MQSECFTPQFKELEQLKLSPSTKSATADKFITKNHKKQCRMLRSIKVKSKLLVKSKVPSIKKFQIFCCKIEIVEKIK